MTLNGPGPPPELHERGYGIGNDTAEPARLNSKSGRQRTGNSMHRDNMAQTRPYSGRPECGLLRTPAE